MKITLHHGSSHIIETPEIREPERTLDFGKGFYTTTSSEQAASLVRSRIGKKMWADGYVNTYLFDADNARKILNIKQFEGPTEEWVDFVLQNRVVYGFNHSYDIVIGPVANDNVYRQFALFEGGIISKQSLIAELMTYKLVDQYLFHTPESLKFLEYQAHKPVEL